MDWIERIVTPAVEQGLASVGAVLIEGPRAVGKTSLGRRLAGSEALLDRDRALLSTAMLDPTLILDGDAPRLLDEYQLVPGLWDNVRGRIDDVGGRGLYILTGSAPPDDDDPDQRRHHSGAGRIAPVRMRTLSFAERGCSSGEVSLRALLDREVPPGGDRGRISVADAVEAIAIGGFPAQIGASAHDASFAHAAYLRLIAERDVERVDGTSREPELVRRFISSWARNTATTAPIATIARISDDRELNDRTSQAYTNVFERLFLIEDQPAWKPGLRSRARLRGVPKRHLADPCLAAAALGAGTDVLLGPEIELTGFLFESQVVHDLRIYAQPFSGRVLHYRDSNGLEADAIVERPDGTWIAVEVKLGSRQIDDASANLLRLRAQVSDAAQQNCAGLVVVSADSYTHLRKDGVLVTSVAALGP